MYKLVIYTCTAERKMGYNHNTHEQIRGYTNILGLHHLETER